MSLNGFRVLQDFPSQRTLQRYEQIFYRISRFSFDSKIVVVLVL